MSDQGTWIKYEMVDPLKELTEFKALLKYFESVRGEYYQKYYRPDSFYNSPALVSLLEPTLGHFLDLNKSGVYIGDGEFDFRIEYTDFASRTLNYLVYIYAMMFDTEAHGNSDWLQFHFGNLYQINKRFFYSMHGGAVDELIDDWLYRSFKLWEFGLRGLVKHVTEHEEIKVIRKKGAIGGTLMHTDSIGVIWKNFVIRYLGEDDPEIENLYNLSIDIRNTIHNYSIHYPNDDNANDRIREYKGIKYEFRIGHALNFLYSKNVRMIVKDNFDLMLKLFQNEKINKYDYIPGYFKKRWYE